MKKLIAAVLLTASFAFALTSCESFVCTKCGGEFDGTGHKTAFGTEVPEEVVFCDECAAQLGIE